MRGKKKERFCELLAKLIIKSEISKVKFYTAVGITKPYFYDILSGKVNPPPPLRQFAMIKQLKPTKEERLLFFDLAAKERGEVPADIAELLKDEKIMTKLRAEKEYKELFMNGENKDE
ncbi:MAG: hypothetical protein RR436_07040 [Clostridia bacterium]